VKIVLTIIAMAFSSCKTVNTDTQLKVVGGFDATGRQFPAAVQFLSCSGTKIADQAILTAAHCLIDKESGDLRNELRRNSSIDLHYGLSVDQKSKYQVAVEAVAVHRSYVKKSRELAGRRAKDKEFHDAIDIAVLFLKNDTPEISSARLINRSPSAGELVVVTGYGCEQLRGDLLDPTGPVIVEGETHFLEGARLKYASVPIKRRTDQFASVADQRDPLGDLTFKLCPGDSGSAAYAIPDRNPNYSEKELQQMTFQEVVGVNSYLSAFDSSFTRIDDTSQGSLFQCLQQLLRSKSLQTDQNGLIAACP
jgi:hypothetical protein